MELTTEERAALADPARPGLAMAMRIVVRSAELLGAPGLVPVRSAHADGCLYHGDSAVLFLERLVALGARVRVPTTLNVGSLDLKHPGLVRAGAHARAMGRRLMDAHVALGCTATWTCAPYQAGHRPALGEQIAWGESNAVVFANSVLGARTNRYGDFLDVCAAISARAPRCGLHVSANRAARVVVDTSALSEALRRREVLYPVLGAWLGAELGAEVAVFTGLPRDLPEDCLKALGAGAAATGAVGLFHVAGVTPEAPSVEAACRHRPPERVIRLTPAMVRAARDRLSTTAGSSLDCVALGSPHFSLAECRALLRRLGGRRARLPVYVCTSRRVLADLEAEDLCDPLAAAGVTLVVDTCVVVTPILTGHHGVMMTNSAKFAHYGKANTGYDTVFGSLGDCVESAVRGRVARDEGQWA